MIKTPSFIAQNQINKEHKMSTPHDKVIRPVRTELIPRHQQRPAHAQ